MSISKIIDLKKQIVEVEEKIKEAENKISKIQLESKYNEEAHKFVNSFNFIPLANHFVKNTSPYSIKTFTLLSGSDQKERCEATMSKFEQYFKDPKVKYECINSANSSELVAKI